MYPGDVPSCLQGLTQVEEMLIARACPIMCVYRKRGGQRGYKGHDINLPQNIDSFLDTLPCNVNDLPILIVCRKGAENTHADFRVRRSKVLSALHWLKQKNICYRNINWSQCLTAAFRRCCTPWSPCCWWRPKPQWQHYVSLGRMKTALIPHTTLTVTPSYHFPFVRKQKTTQFTRSSMVTTLSIGLLLEKCYQWVQHTIPCHHGIPSTLSSCHWRSYQSSTRASCFHYRWLQTSGNV